MYTPPAVVAPPMVSTFMSWSRIAGLIGTAAPSSAVFASANSATYIPITVPTTCVVRRLWWVNGSTVNASYNVDVGIYADAGYKPGVKRISTGSTAQGTATQVQFVDVTDTTLQPGLYWIAFACSNTSATFFRGSLAAGYDAIARFEEASALPLPATATPVESSASTNVYLCGFATTASP